jgi:hypothetical protein
VGDRIKPRVSRRRNPGLGTTKSREPTKWAIDLEFARLVPDFCRPFHGLEPYIYDAPRVAASPPPWALFYRPLRGLICANIWVMTNLNDAPRVAASPPPWALFYRPLRGLICANIWVMTNLNDAPRVAASPPPWALFYRPLRGLICANIWVMTNLRLRTPDSRLFFYSLIDIASSPFSIFPSSIPTF